MKKQIIISMLSIALLVSLFSLSFAQRPGMRAGQGPGMRVAQRPGMGMCAYIPDLTEVQTAKIEELWLAHQKEAQPKRLQIEKMRVELHELMIAEKPDVKKINALQEKMSQVRLETQKKGVAHRLAVRELLTEKQRILFDNHPMGRRGAGFYKGRRGGCQGPGFGRGMRGPGFGAVMGMPPAADPGAEE